jgi:hypothetical protein
MTTQPTFFGHANTSARQPELFDQGGRASSLTCQCGHYLERTPSGFLTCPRGHGKLKADSYWQEWDQAQPEDDGGLFDTSPE